MSAMKRVPRDFSTGKKNDADGATPKGRAGKGRDYPGKTGGKTGRFSDDKGKERKPYPGNESPEGKRPYKKREENTDKPAFRKRAGGNEGSDRPWNRKTSSGDTRYSERDKTPETEKRPWSKDQSSPEKERKPYSRETRSSRPFNQGEEGHTGNRFSKDKPFSDERPVRKTGTTRTDRFSKDDNFSSGKEHSERPFRKPDSAKTGKYTRDDKFSSGKEHSERPYRKPEGEKPERFPKDKKFSSEKDHGDRPYRRRTSDETPSGSRYSSTRDPYTEKPGDESRYKGRKPSSAGFRKSSPQLPKEKKSYKDDGTIRLNKFIANAGICSRREADTLIESGAVSVNGIIVTELGTKITRDDKVQFGGETLHIEKKVYLLLNKPKGYITTVDDPQERNTVMLLIRDACRERVYPVGRLDRNTTGLLLFTNDGEMAKKLTHPGHKVRKVYHVELNKALAKSDMQRLADGVELEDGMMAVDEIAYTGAGSDKKNIGVVIHSGKNRVIRRLFEELEYEVVKLDRVAFANLTKKDLPRGKWRMLDEKEISLLQMI